MAVDPRKRQKQLERRKAKQKTKLVARPQLDLRSRFALAAQSPLLHCCVEKILWEQGIGNLVVSRELKSGNVAFCVLLIDVYCLGIKYAAYDIVARSTYDGLIQRLYAERPAMHKRPEWAKKLVIELVDYAQRLGFAPHHDFVVAQRILDGVDASLCHEEFSLGKDGKPYFIAGPRDDSARCNHIINTLRRTCGEGHFDYLVHLSQADLSAADRWLLTDGTEASDAGELDD